MDPLVSLVPDYSASIFFERSAEAVTRLLIELMLGNLWFSRFMLLFILLSLRIL
jgi:hypothetical protein